jgi:RNA polymerase sigma-70 factor, ECF subfamily
MGGGTGTSTGLLYRAVQRQPDAWDNLVSLYGPLVYRWCRRWGLQAKDAENVGQEVFLRVLQGLPAFRHDRPGDSFRAWLRRIARNCYLDHVQRQQRTALGIGGSESLKRIEQIPDDHANDEDPEATDREDQAVLYQQAVQLIRREYTQRDWTIFERVVIRGDSPAVVATEMQVSANVVYLIKSRVLHRLREEFAELIEL